MPLVRVREDESLENALPVGMLEIAGDASLVAVDRKVIRGHTLDRGRRPIAGLITAARDLDLHHVSAVIGEHQRAVRSGERARQIDHADSIERTTRTAGQPGVTDRQSTVDA